MQSKEKDPALICVQQLMKRPFEKVHTAVMYSLYVLEFVASYDTMLVDYRICFV